MGRQHEGVAVSLYLCRAARWHVTAHGNQWQCEEAGAVIAMKPRSGREWYDRNAASETQQFAFRMLSKMCPGCGKWLGVRVCATEPAESGLREAAE